jgi:flagellar protein FlaI
VERDTIGFGKIDPLMHDQLVEDISCSGMNKPIFVWHKNFGSIKTNLTYDCKESLDNFVTGLIHRAGRHVSTAFPIIDVTLPGKHRLAVSYGTEVTPFGTNFTIRKFREDPYTIIDLISMGTIDETLAAYLWLLMENKMSLMILGTTGAGKTTALNAIACLIPATNKVITIEEVSEINLPHENWISMIPRYSFSLETEHIGEIPLYELMKAAVRHRPDYIMVGEVRGEEAFVLFQALATGHGGLCTIHAEDFNTAVKRLTSPPMNIPFSNISLMNCAILVRRIESSSFTRNARMQLRRKFAQVSEIVGNTPYDTFVWNSMHDVFDNKLDGSVLLRRIADKLDVSLEELSIELERRKIILQWMVERRIRNYLKVSNTIAEYNLNPQSVYDKASRALGR